MGAGAWSMTHRNLEVEFFIPKGIALYSYNPIILVNAVRCLVPSSMGTFPNPEFMSSAIYNCLPAQWRMFAHSLRIG